MAKLKRQMAKLRPLRDSCHLNFDLLIRKRVKRQGEVRSPGQAYFFDLQLSTFDSFPPKSPNKFTGRSSYFCPAVEWSAKAGR